MLFCTGVTCVSFCLVVALCLTVWLFYPPVGYSQENTPPVWKIAIFSFGMATSPTGRIFSYLPHHLDLASEDSVDHSTCMSVLARRRAIMANNMVI